MMSAMIVRAPRILFWVSVLMLILGSFNGLGVAYFFGDSFEQDSPRRWAFLFQAVYQSLSGAALPFFGAALLWRIDMKWFGGKATSEAAE